MAENGESLYQASCIGCHSRMTGGDGTVLYQRDDKIVTSMDALHQRVTHCANSAATNWTEADIEAVTADDAALAPTISMIITTISR